MWGVAETVKAYLEIDRNIHVTSTAATNEPSGPTRGCILSGGEVRRSERVDNLVDAWPIEWDFLVVGVAETSERELVVTTLIRLESNFTTRTSDGLEQLARGFLVFLRFVIHLEWTGAAENEGSGNTGVTRASERLSMIHINLQNHSPLVNLLPLNLCTRKWHLDDLARFRAQHITIAILALHTEDSIFSRSTRV